MAAPLRLEQERDVESPRTLIRSIGSICTATFKGMGVIRFEGRGANVYAISAAAATAIEASGRSAAGIESVGNMLRHPAGSHQHDIEADIALRVVRMMREPQLGGGNDPALGPFGDGFRRVVDLHARLDLDKSQRAAAAGDNVDFAEGVFQRRATIR